MIAAAVTASAVLALIAGIHLYWAAGGRWPGRDERSLAETVVGTTPGGRMPGPAACVAVAELFSAAGLLPLVASGLLPLPLPARLVHLGLGGAALVFGLRGVFGFFDHLLRPGIVGLPFHRLNRRLYSPLCLALAALLAASGLG